MNRMISRIVRALNKVGLTDVDVHHNTGIEGDWEWIEVTIGNKIENREQTKRTVKEVLDQLYPNNKWEIFIFFKN